jgi:hypothetical protein
MEQRERSSRKSDQSSSPASVQLSRRALLRGSSAMALAAGAATLMEQSAHAQEVVPPVAMRSPQHALIAASANTGMPELPSAAVIAFSRMAFGAVPQDWDIFQNLAATDEERLQIYVEQQLNPAAIDDSD